MTESSGSGAAPHRAGFVALLGPPNSGKSTLLNRILGEKLAIVTAKPQTTRSRILGIHNLPGAQIMFVDTPGLHESGKRLNTALNDAVAAALKNCDLALLLLDLARGWEAPHDALLSAVAERATPTLLVGTKCDKASDAKEGWPAEAASCDLERLRVSGLTGEGVPSLLEQVVSRLPESPPLYDENELTDRPLRWLAAELVRESVFEILGQELPYEVAVEVVSFKEIRPELTEIHANLLVARNSQKRIVVGKGGATIKRIGTRSRREVEKLVGNQVHLQLFVKVDPKWLKSPKRIESLGYY